jgi:hypothetical protein
MSEQTKNDALGAMAAFIDDNRQVSVGGVKYELAKLRPIDLAAARDYVVQLRTERFIGTVQHKPFEPTIMAKAMAEIQCAPLSLFDVMQDPDGRIKLLHLSMTRAGAKMPLMRMQADFDATLQDELYAYVLWVSGVLPEPILDPSPDEADPTEAEATTVSSGT